MLRRTRFRAASCLVGGDAYELRIAGLNAGLNAGSKWKLASVSISDEDKAAGATIEAKPAATSEEGWLRVAIRSPESRDIHWTVRFTPL